MKPSVRLHMGVLASGILLKYPMAISGSIIFKIDTVTRTTASDPVSPVGLIVGADSNALVLLPVQLPYFSETVSFPSNSVAPGDSTSSELFGAQYIEPDETVTLSNAIASDSVTLTVT